MIKSFICNEKKISDENETADVFFKRLHQTWIIKNFDENNFLAVEEIKETSIRTTPEINYYFYDYFFRNNIKVNEIVDISYHKYNKEYRLNDILNKPFVLDSDVFYFNSQNLSREQYKQKYLKYYHKTIQKIKKV